MITQNPDSKLRTTSPSRLSRRLSLLLFIWPLWFLWFLWPRHGMVTQNPELKTQNNFLRLTRPALLQHLSTGPDNSEPRTHNSELPQTGGVISLRERGEVGCLHASLTDLSERSARASPGGNLLEFPRPGSGDPGVLVSSSFPSRLSLGEYLVPPVMVAKPEGIPVESVISS
jgi:hypothetical protein